jgi:hypothetical protein
MIRQLRERQLTAVLGEALRTTTTTSTYVQVIVSGCVTHVQCDAAAHTCCIVCLCSPGGAYAACSQ